MNHRIVLLLSLAALSACKVEVVAAKDPCASFSITDIRVARPEYAVGSFIENMRDVYMTFSAPASKVHLQIMDSSGKVNTSYFYQDYLYKPGQTSFAMGAALALSPHTSYTYIVTGQKVGSACSVTRSGSFTTSNF